MRVKRVRFSLPNTFNIYDYVLGCKVCIKYNKHLRLDIFKRFDKFYMKYCKIVCSDKKLIRTDIPIGKQGIFEGDIIYILPLSC